MREKKDGQKAGLTRRELIRGGTLVGAGIIITESLRRFGIANMFAPNPGVAPEAQAPETSGDFVTETPQVSDADHLKSGARGFASESNAATNTVEPTVTSTDQPTATDTPEPTSTNTVEPTATATETAQPTATETEVPKTTVVFDGNPNSEAGRALGDGGFRSDCDFGNCDAWKRVVWGPFLRKKDHESQGIKNNVTVRITVEGEKGHIKFGATDSGKYKDPNNMFGLGGVEADLANGPVTHEFFWEGINDEDPDNLTGFGFETLVQQLPGEKAKISNIKIEIVN